MILTELYRQEVKTMNKMTIKSEYYPRRKIERLLYAVQVWYTLSERQRNDIYAVYLEA